YGRARARGVSAMSVITLPFRGGRGRRAMATERNSAKDLEIYSDIRGPVRVRFAPSPTGYLHVGGVRTAIYNDLLRHRQGGAFVLRIEDTDRERSDEAMTRQIQDALVWIGVEWDEGPYLQSARLDRHRERGEELLAAGRAYRCFCTPEE